MALLLTFAIFAHLAVCGRATLHLLGTRFGHVRTWLLAPALGLAVLTLLVMVLNQAGVPIDRFARPLMIATLVGSVVVLYRGRVTTTRALLPFIGLALGALLLGSWPALAYGLNWVSYGNDDMTNYCLGAQRFMTHGFYDVPTPAELAGGDYTYVFWLLNVATMERFASQLIIGCTASATGLNTVQVFMPVILSQALVQLWAIIALAYSCPRRRLPALIAGTILATAPLWHFGTTYQLIAQVGGLGLTIALLVVTARTRFPRGRAGRLKLGFLSALLISGLGVTYPEVMPFFVLGWGIYIALQVQARRRWITGLLPTIGFALLFVTVLLRQNVFSTTFTLLIQVESGMDIAAVTNRVALFPYFLMPAGPAFFFGFDIIVARYAYPLPALIAGFGAAFIAAGLWLRGLGARAVSASVLAGMFLIGLVLFTSKNGFGVFKLTMFALPFVAVELTRLLDFRRLRPVTWTLFAGLLAVSILGSVRYLKASLADTANVVNELFDASASRGNMPAGPAPVWSDMASSPVGKLFMLEKPASQAAFISQIFGARFFGVADRPHADWVYRMLPGNIRENTAAHIVDYIEHQVYRNRHALGLDFFSRASADTAAADPATVMVTSKAELFSFNKLTANPFAPSAGVFTYAPLDRLKNHLVFVQSRQGHHYYLGDAGQIAVYKPQFDSYRPDDYFFVIGRHLLFRVVNPTDSVRLRFSMTASILGQGYTELPVEGRIKDASGQPLPLGLVGSGSANVYSAPLQPLRIDEAAYLALDLGRDPRPIGLPATGLQAIYNKSLSVDARFGLGYCRDISVISEGEYQALPRKKSLEHFPADLVGPDAAEYSGLYEDGWASARAFVVLGPGIAGEQVVVRGMLPQLPGMPPSPQTVELLIDGQTAVREEIKPGDFALSAPVRSAGPAVRIELRFSHTLPLPAPDNRPVSVLLKSISLRSVP